MRGLRWLLLGAFVIGVAFVLPLALLTVGVIGFAESEPGSFAALASAFVASLAFAALVIATWAFGAFIDP